MKKLFRIAAAIGALLVVAVVALPFLIPVETYKQEIIRQVQTATGREFHIDGAMKLAVFPTIGIEMKEVRLANAKGFSEKNMVELKALTVDVALLPLLKKDIVVNRFVLDEPVIHLEKNAKGQGNWVFAPTIGGGGGEASTPAPRQDSGSALHGLKLGDVKIHNGTLVWKDAAAPKPMSFTKMDADLALSRLDAPLSLKGNADWNGKTINLAATVDHLAALIEGKTAQADVAVVSDPLKVNFNGKVSANGAKGDAVATIPSIPELAKWAGAAFEWQGKGALSFSAKGALDATAEAIQFSDADLSLDELKAKGQLRVGLAGKVPEVKGQFTTDKLDINAFLPAEKRADADSWLISSAHAAASAGWSSAPIDVSGLKAVNADITVKAAEIVIQKLTIGKTEANFKTRDGKADITIPSMQLYGGTGNAAISVNGAASPMQVNANLRVEQIDSASLLKDAINFTRLEGKGSMQWQVSASGNSEKTLVSTLNGKGNVRFLDGAIIGINLADMVRNVKSSFNGAESDVQKTDFAELSGSFAITNGVVSNNDLSMKAPLLRLSGSGQVNLPERFINYRLVPAVVATLKGQGGKDKQGLEVPVIIEGPLDAPSFRPDLQAMITDAINNPEKLENTVKDVKEQIKENKNQLKDLKNIFKGDGANGEKPALKLPF